LSDDVSSLTQKLRAVQQLNNKAQAQLKHFKDDQRRRQSNDMYPTSPHRNESTLTTAASPSQHSIALTPSSSFTSELEILELLQSLGLEHYYQVSADGLFTRFAFVQVWLNLELHGSR